MKRSTFQYGFLLILASALLVIFIAVLNFRPDKPNAPALKATPADSSTPELKFVLNWPFGEDESANIVSADLLTTNIYVVFDGSGSMDDAGCSGGQKKVRSAKRALIAFADSLPIDANLGMLAFDRTGITERVALRGRNRQLFKSSVEQVSPGGGTPLKFAIEEAYGRLTDQGKKQLGYGEYHLVVVTDGAASEGQDPTIIVSAVLKDSPVIVHTVGFCISENHSLNQPGRTLYRTANDAKSLQQGLQTVLAESPSFTTTEFNQ